MADCPYAEMEWYCCLAEGHDGPHMSVQIGSTDLTRTEGPPPPPMDTPPDSLGRKSA